MCDWTDEYQNGALSTRGGSTVVGYTDAHNALLGVGGYDHKDPSHRND